MVTSDLSLLGSKPMIATCKVKKGISEVPKHGIWVASSRMKDARGGICKASIHVRMVPLGQNQESNGVLVEPRTALC